MVLKPEVTGVIQSMYPEIINQFGNTNPIRLFYYERCYRYESPQKGRYREFYQFGIELLNGVSIDDKKEVIGILHECLSEIQIKYKFYDSVKRGLNYYIEDGFECEVDELGSQKQIAGGGRYKEGIGWAIGVSRLLDI